MLNDLAKQWGGLSEKPGLEMIYFNNIEPKMLIYQSTRIDLLYQFRAFWDRKTLEITWKDDLHFVVHGFERKRRKLGTIITADCRDNSKLNSSFFSRIISMCEFVSGNTVNLRAKLFKFSFLLKNYKDEKKMKTRIHKELFLKLRCNSKQGIFSDIFS